MKNEITTVIHQIQYGPEPVVEQAIDNELGCEKSNPDFAVRAADIIVGASADQFQDLLYAMSHFSKEIHQNSGDDAYQAASKYLALAGAALRSRMGN